MKPKLVIITGTPGVGKTTLAKALARKLRVYHLDLHPHYQQLATKYDRRKQCYILDRQKVLIFVRAMLRLHPEGMIIDSHVTHNFPRSMVSLCIVLRCPNLKVLQQRLRKRKYSA